MKRTTSFVAVALAAVAFAVACNDEPTGLKPGAGLTGVAAFTSPSSDNFEQCANNSVLQNPDVLDPCSWIHSVLGKQNSRYNILIEGHTDASITAITNEGQLYLFVKGTDQRPYVNVASETGVWSGWLVLPNPGLTDRAMAAAAVGGTSSRVLLFAKGIDDLRLYVRSTM